MLRVVGVYPVSRRSEVNNITLHVTDEQIAYDQRLRIEVAIDGPREDLTESSYRDVFHV
jgi:hypothetical protein